MERANSEYHKRIRELRLDSWLNTDLSFLINIIEIKKGNGNCTLIMFSRYSWIMILYMLVLFPICGYF